MFLLKHYQSFTTKNLQLLIITHFANLNPEHQEMELRLQVAVTAKKHVYENYALPAASWTYFKLMLLVFLLSEVICCNELTFLPRSIDRYFLDTNEGRSCFLLLKP